MNKLEKILKEIPVMSDTLFGKTVMLTIEQKDKEIERLEKEKEWIIGEYVKYKKLKSFHYQKLSNEKIENELREMLKEAMNKK